MKFDFETYMKSINFDRYKYQIESIMKELNDDDMTDWCDIPMCVSESEIKDIIKTSKEIRKKCDCFIVVGIGGSFLGAKMVISALSNYFEQKDCEILFAGTSLSSDYLSNLIDYVKDKDICLNLISKSGSTLEPNLAFDALIEVMKEKYDDISDRIFITTDKNKSPLLDLAKKEGYKRFNVPEHIGGRYSVLTPVGLLPIAVAGFDIRKLLKGASECDQKQALKYAIIRHELYMSRKSIESFTFYDEKLLDFGEWLKQLFAETQGKSGRGILPISVLNTRDLHSLGQYFQEGDKILFETVFNIQNKAKINTKYNKTLNEINNIAVDAVAKAHYENEVYSSIITIDKLDEYTLGYLIYFFELAAATGGYLLYVNPFDQPGVGKYKELILEGLNK